MSNEQEKAINDLKNGDDFSKSKYIKFRNNKEVVLVAIEKWGMAFSYASKKLRSDKEVVMVAVKKVNDYKILEHIPNISMRYEARREITKMPTYNQFLKHCEFTYAYDYGKDLYKKDFLKNMRQNKIKLHNSMMNFYTDLLLMWQYSRFLKSKRWWSSESQMFAEFAKEIKFYLYRKFENKEVVKVNVNLFEYNNEDTILAVKLDGEALKYSSPEQQNNIEIVLEALKNNPESIKHIGNNLLLEINSNEPIQYLQSCLDKKNLEDNLTNKSNMKTKIVKI